MESWGNGGAGLDESMEESEEYRLLEAYCDRRRQQRSPLRLPSDLVAQMGDVQGQDDAQFSGKPMRKLLQMRAVPASASSTLLVHRVTAHLVQIADDSTLLHEEDDLESDGGTEDDVIIKELVELLKKHGDDLDEKIKKDKDLQQKIQKSFSYGLFEKVTTSILESLVAPRGSARGAVPSNKQQIAWACEVTHRLSAVDCIPRRRALVFGTQYIKQHLSAWVQQHGGWDSVFEDVD